MIDNSFLSESPYYLCLSGFQRQRGQIVSSHRQFLLHEFESGRCLLQITPYLDDLIWKKIKKDAFKVFFSENPSSSLSVLQCGQIVPSWQTIIALLIWKWEDAFYKYIITHFITLCFNGVFYKRSPERWWFLLVKINVRKLLW